MNTDLRQPLFLIFFSPSCVTPGASINSRATARVFYVGLGKKNSGHVLIHQILMQQTSALDFKCQTN